MLHLVGGGFSRAPLVIERQSSDGGVLSVEEEEAHVAGRK